MLLEARGLSKSFTCFDGSLKQAVAGVSFRAEGGKPLGLLGRNGAGKTTMMRMIMNIFPPDSGELLFDSKPMRASGVRLGYLAEERGLYRKMGVLEQMVYFGRLKGLSRSEANTAAVDWLKRLEMTEYTNAKLETLSKGNQQKIQLAIALIAKPDIIVLDEPFSGLDPVNAAQLKQIVREQSERGAIVLFSSHQMAAVEDFCDDIVMLQRGQVVLDGRLDEIKKTYPRDTLRLQLDGGAELYEGEQLKAAIGEGGTISGIDRSGALIKLTDSTDTHALMSRLLGSGLPVLKMEIVEPSLDEIFVDKSLAFEQKEGKTE